MRQELVQLGGSAHALAMQILGNREDAADAVHDAIATALARPESYDSGKGSLKAWFMRVVRNRCLDMLRSRRSEGVPADEAVHPGHSPDALAEQDQQFAALRRALAKLPAEKREILVLRDYMDLSYADIAIVLGIAAGTVMSRLHRARLDLKEAINSDDGK